MNGFRLEGYSNLKGILIKMPENGYRKPIAAAFKKAAVPVREEMIKSLPKELKRLKKIIKAKPGKGKSLTMTIGPYGREAVYMNRRGVKWDPYMLIYWFNYGTLSNRAPEHGFKTARKKVSAGWRGGLKAGLFMEAGVDRSLPRAQKVFEAAYAYELDTFLKKEAAR